MNMSHLWENNSKIIEIVDSYVWGGEGEDIEKMCENYMKEMSNICKLHQPINPRKCDCCCNLH